MKKFPKILYITRSDFDSNNDAIEYFVQENKEFVKEEEEDTEVAVYQLVRVGSVVKSSKIVFE